MAPGVTGRDATASKKEDREETSETDLKTSLYQAALYQTYDVRKIRRRYNSGSLTNVGSGTHIITEMWLTPHILDEATTALDWQGLFRADRTQDSSSREEEGSVFI